MAKGRSSMLPMPWECWKEFDGVATALYSEIPGRITAALNKIAEWQKEENVPVEAEISISLLAGYQSEHKIIHGVARTEALSQPQLKSILAMAIQRLVSAVVDQSPNRTKSSKAYRAKAAGLPRLLVDIRNESAHGKLRSLSLLLSASKEALAWLKINYWEKQAETLKQARDALKWKLDEHYVLVSLMNYPSALAWNHQHCEDPGVMLLLELVKAQEKHWDSVFEELLDLSLSSPQELVSIIVDDGLLTEFGFSLFSEPLLENSSLTENTDLTSASDIAWKFTMRQLSSHLPRLPAMLLTAIMKHISSTSNDEESCKTGGQSVPLSDLGADIFEVRWRSFKQLISWCHWLLGKKISKGAKDSKGKQLRQLSMPDKDLQQLKSLRVPVAKSVKVQIDKKLLCQLLQGCHQFLARGKPRQPARQFRLALLPQQTKQRRLPASIVASKVISSKHAR